MQTLRLGCTFVVKIVGGLGSTILVKREYNPFFYWFHCYSRLIA